MSAYRTYAPESHGLERGRAEKFAGAMCSHEGPISWAVNLDRLAAEFAAVRAEGAAEERARIVEWLRGLAHGYPASAIEAGEHEAGK